jgi:L-lysine 2,3-aminomutase
VSVTSKRIEETPVDGNWRESMRRAVRDPDELARLLELPAGTLTRETAAARAFPLLVPREFVARMRKGDADDPLLRQVLPTRAEGIPQPQFGPDPLAEHGLAMPRKRRPAMPGGRHSRRSQVARRSPRSF